MKSMYLYFTAGYCKPTQLEIKVVVGEEIKHPNTFEHHCMGKVVSA